MDDLVVNCLELYCSLGLMEDNRTATLGLSLLRPKLEDLTVLERSPDLLKNVKIGQDQLQLIMKHILSYGGYSHFG